jgi:hypothetical protein
MAMPASKRRSNPEVEKERRKRTKLSSSDSEVVYKWSSSISRGDNKPAGHHQNNRTKSNYQAGDTRPMFGQDRVAFRGGEGGRGWAVPSTKC